MRAIDRLVRAVTKLKPGGSSPKYPQVIVHDPAADGPKNLDDPFLDAQAQQRVGELIARTRAKAQASKPDGDDPKRS